MALSGDFPESEALAVDLEQCPPDDTFVKFTYAPVHADPIASKPLIQVVSAEGIEPSTY